MTGHERRLDCTDFEALLTDVLDGCAGPADRDALGRHAAGCAGCRELQDLAAEGRNWLRDLQEVEPPARLVHNILAATDAAIRAPKAPERRGRFERLRAEAAAWAAEMGRPIVEIARQPRLVLTAAMAFFSLSLLANMAGMTLSDIGDLHPDAIARGVSRRYHATAATVVRYYENARVVREVESRLRDLRETVEPHRGGEEPELENPGPNAAPPRDPVSDVDSKRQVHG